MNIAKQMNQKYKHEMTTRVEMISPKEAREYVSCVHPLQRHVRKANVEKLADAMINGRWVLIPDGIAFDVNGYLIQGNHRLHAIIETGLTLPFNVTRNAPQQAFERLDQGMTRSVSDATGIPRLETEIIMVLYSMHTGLARRPDVSEIKWMHGNCKEHLDIFVSMNSAKTCRKGFSAAYRAGAVSMIYSGRDVDWIESSHVALITGDIQSLSAIQAAFWKRVISGQFSSGAGAGIQRARLYTATLKALDNRKQDVSKMYVTDADIYEAKQLAGKVIGIKE